MSSLLGNVVPLPTWGKTSATAEQAVREFAKNADSLKEGEGREVNLSSFSSRSGEPATVTTVVSALRKAIESTNAPVRVSIRDGVVYLAKGTMTKRPRIAAKKAVKKADPAVDSKK